MGDAEGRVTTGLIPAGDGWWPGIPANYSIDNMDGKAVCKEELQKELGLEVILKRKE